MPTAPRGSQFCERLGAGLHWRICWNYAAEMNALLCASFCGSVERSFLNMRALALARCVPVLDDALARRGRASLRALVESTWLRLGGPACLADREQGIRDADAYFALLDAQSSAGALRDPENFAGKLHDLFAPADTRSGIRVEIMPIHQAKGLGVGCGLSACAGAPLAAG